MGVVCAAAKRCAACDGEEVTWCSVDDWAALWLTLLCFCPRQVGRVSKPMHAEESARCVTRLSVQKGQTTRWEGEGSRDRAGRRAKGNEEQRGGSWLGPLGRAENSLFGCDLCRDREKRAPRRASLSSWLFSLSASGLNNQRVHRSAPANAIRALGPSRRRASCSLGPVNNNQRRPVRDDLRRGDRS